MSMVEAWAVVGPRGVEEAWASIAEAERHARAMTVSTPDDFKIVHLVEHDRRAVGVVQAAVRLERAEQEAANKHFPREQWGPWLTAKRKLREAVARFTKARGRG